MESVSAGYLVAESFKYRLTPFNEHVLMVQEEDALGASGSA